MNASSKEPQQPKADFSCDPPFEYNPARDLSIIDDAEWYRISSSIAFFQGLSPELEKRRRFELGVMRMRQAANWSWEDVRDELKLSAEQVAQVRCEFKSITSLGLWYSVCLALNGRLTPCDFGYAESSSDEPNNAAKSSSTAGS